MTVIPLRPYLRPVNDYGLTVREREVLDALSRSATRRKAAELLGIRDTTAKTHVQNILRKMREAGVHSSTEAVALALREGLIR